MEIDRLIVDVPGLTQLEAERLARAIAEGVAECGGAHGARGGAIDRVHVSVPHAERVDQLARAAVDELLRAVERTQ